MPPAIEITGVSKRFRLYHAKKSTLKERVVKFGRSSYEDFWALRDIDFEIAEGSTVGLLGHNGSGKSTLLKCIAGILQPTTGEIATRGRLAALLELGAGFHPDLSGRENIYLNGAILGLNKREIARRFDEIVAFAELEQFIDNQVKHYSSGMVVRLGFAVAVNVDPEILLVDEVLSVGDEAFQRKCLDRVRQFQREGRTIVVVTHAAELVRQVCDHAAVLDHGRMIANGPPGEAIRALREHLLLRGGLAEAASLVVDEPDVEAAPVDPNLMGDGRRRHPGLRITDVRCSYPGEEERPYLMPRDPLQVRVSYEVSQPMEDLVFGVGISDEEGRAIFGSNTDILGVPVPAQQPGRGEVVFSFSDVPLLDGSYFLTLGVHSHDEGIVYDWSDQEHHFEVMNPGRTAGRVSMDMNVSFLGTVEQIRAH
ncbi:MAG TPA: ABC transporter ATP-binding protein [Acidimicrobiales bacterium]|nr:ABC transporter ATP-binding protein [Acidimicrobiales bacterium]